MAIHRDDSDDEPGAEELISLEALARACRGKLRTGPGDEEVARLQGLADRAEAILDAHQAE